MEAALPAVALDHVGLAVQAIVASPLARALGVEDAATIAMPSGVAIARVGPGRQLELVQPAKEGSPIERFLERRGPGLHHVAFRVDVPLPEVIERLREAGIETVGGIEASSDGRPSVFLHPSGTGGVLVELVEGAPPT